MQRIFLPRQNSSSLQFQAKAPAAAASVSLFPFTLTASAETAPGATLFSGSPCNPRWGVPTSAPGRTKIIIAIKQKLKGGKKLLLNGDDDLSQKQKYTPPGKAKTEGRQEATLWQGRALRRYELTLKKRPYPKCVWVEVREWEDREAQLK